MSIPSSWLTYGTETFYTQSAVQNIFSTIFLTLNFLIAFLGERLIKNQGQRRLLRHKTLPVTNLSPFLSVNGALKGIWVMRGIPGGFFGFLMISSGAFGLTARYVLNSYVVSTRVPWRCDMEEGIVTTSNNGTNLFSPSADWPPATFIFSAQKEIANYGDEYSCEKGIYKILGNNDSYVHCPTTKDVLGSWTCTQEPGLALTGNLLINDTLLDNYVNNSTFLYPRQYWVRRGLPGLSVMAWSVNDTGASPERLRFRILYADNTNLPSLNQTGNTTNFECALNVSNPTWIPTPVDAVSVLSSFSQTLLGVLMYDTDPADYSNQVELVLNAMSMMVGSDNGFATKSSAASFLGDDPTYGCLVYMTKIHPQVFNIVLVLMIILLAIILVDVWDLVLNKLDKHASDVRSLPVELVDWQLALTKKLVNDDTITVRDLPHCRYSWDGEKIDCRKIEKKGKTDYRPPHDDTMSLNADAGCTYLWDPVQKTVECHRKTKAVRSDSVGSVSEHGVEAKTRLGVASAAVEVPL